MLSKQVKERIRKNKQRRFQCRKKQGRELHRAMRRARSSTRDFFNIWAGGNKNAFFDFSKLKDLTEFFTPPLEPYKSDFRGYLITQAMKHGKPIRISLERDDLFDPEFSQKLYGEVKLGGLNTHNSADNDIIIGLDPAVKEASKFFTIMRGKRRAALKGGIFDVKMDFSKVRLDEAHLAGDVQAEGRKQDVFDMLALAAKAVIEPQMYRKPDGSLELMSFGLVPAPELKVEPGHSPPMPSEAMGVQPMPDYAQTAQDIKDGKVPFVTLDSYSDFKGSDDANRTRAIRSDVP